MSEESTDQFVPPYISFAQLENVLERMRNEGVPARIDRSYLSSWSGSAQAQFLKATASLELRDEHGRPTDRLKRLVAEPDARPTIIAELLHEKYPEAIALGLDATQQQLDDVFKEYPGISGSTTRKAITFFLHAAKFAGIQTSPFFKTPRTGGSSGSRTARTRAKNRATPSADEQPPAPPPPSDPLAGLHPAIVTLVKALPAFEEDGTKPLFPSAERDAWFAYATATFNLIYERPEGDMGAPSAA